MPSTAESGVASSAGLDFTSLPELYIDIRDATTEDVGALANVFIKSFQDDRTAQLLYHHDRIWSVVVAMLRNYLDDDYTHVRVAWDEYTDTIVGWTSISLVTSAQEDNFKFCDSTVLAGCRLLLREAGARRSESLPPLDEARRRNLVTRLVIQNQEGQRRHVDGQHLVINTVAIHPDVFADEIPEIAYKLIDDAKDIAEREYLPLWAQFPQNSLGKLDELFEEVGFAEVGNFELSLTQYANEERRRWRSDWGIQKWRQWVLRTGNWERGRRS